MASKRSNPGWRGALAAVLLAPTGAGAQLCVLEWADRFPAPDLNGSLFAVASFDPGGGPRLFVGGSFQSAAGMPIPYVASWSENGWAPVGGGVNSFVNCLLTFDDGAGPDLYAGGWFTWAGGVLVKRIARWDGSAWSGLGSGMDGLVYALAEHDDGGGPALYAGGNFHDAGGVPAEGVAKWNGSSWSALGGGVSGAARAAASFNGSLYVGGDFLSAGGVPVQRIARWDGQWHPLNAGVNGMVSAMATHTDATGSALYVGGLFTAAGIQQANRIARWSGTGWSALGSGVPGPVAALRSFDDGSGSVLWVGGTAPVMAAWRDGAWQTLASHPSGAGRGLAVHDFGDGERLVAVTSAAAAGTALPVSVLDGAHWAAVSFSPDRPVSSLRTLGPGPGAALYASGGFTSADNRRMAGVARWDGHEWSALDSSNPEQPYLLMLEVFDAGAGPELYATGMFPAGVNGIGRWNGASWEPLGAGLEGGFALCTTVLDDGPTRRLVAGGNFTQAGGQPAMRIAAWNGEAWQTFGAGLPHDAWALAVFDAGSGPRLYASTYFLDQKIVSEYSRVHLWNGAAWEIVGEFVGPAVRQMAVHDDGSGPALYTGGEFFGVNGVPGTEGVARWDGANWSSVGGGLSRCTAIESFDDGRGPALWATSVTSTGFPVEGRLSRWDGTAWEYQAAVIEGVVQDLEVFADYAGPALFLAGDFTRVGGVSSARIARWGCAGCYPDCTGDGALTVADFGCFQSRYVLGDPYADCNASGSLTVADFGCFQGKYVLGCP